MHETSGRLESAVKAYFDPRAKLSQKQLEYLKAYIVHWADAPCYKANPFAEIEDMAALHALIDAGRAISSREDIDNWIDQALELGIDPF